MKKQLLVGAMLMGAFFTANAQFETSFEVAEGYEVGGIYGQNEWLTITDNTEIPVGGMEISTDYASEGTQSFMFTADPNYATQQSVNFFAASPAFSADYSEMVASVDILITEDEDEGTDGANFAIQFEGGEGENAMAVSRFEFVYDNTIAIVDMVGAQPAYVPLEDLTWTPGEWMQVDMIYNFGEGTITYQLNGEVVYEGTVWAGEIVDRFVMLHDNWPGNAAYVDGVSVTEGSTAGNNDVLASIFSVYPNPANDVINIANVENMLVNGVTITDINGRTVKSAQFEGTANATVNVSDLASGVYMMTVSSDKGTAVKKIVKN